MPSAIGPTHPTASTATPGLLRRLPAPQSPIHREQARPTTWSLPPAPPTTAAPQQRPRRLARRPRSSARRASASAGVGRRALSASLRSRRSRDFGAAVTGLFQPWSGRPRTARPAPAAPARAAWGRPPGSTRRAAQEAPPRQQTASGGRVTHADRDVRRILEDGCTRPPTTPDRRPRPRSGWSRCPRTCRRPPRCGPPKSPRPAAPTAWGGRMAASAAAGSTSVWPAKIRLGSSIPDDALIRSINGLAAAVVRLGDLPHRVTAAPRSLSNHRPAGKRRAAGVIPEADHIGAGETLRAHHHRGGQSGATTSTVCSTPPAPRGPRPRSRSPSSPTP